MSRCKRMCLTAVVIFGYVSTAGAATIEELEGKIEEMRKEYESQLRQLRRQIEELKVGQEKTQEVIIHAQETTHAFDNIHFEGYGELHYNNTSEEGKNNKMDFHRMALGWRYRFNDTVFLDAEIDFEHAASELELEYAYLEFLFSEAFNLRIGSLLMPVGYLNEFHEPLLFYSVERPYVQTDIIPTTWQEGGIGILGSPIPELNYRLYLVGGLDASKFTAASGIRKGRSKVSSAKADDLAVVGRLEYAGIAHLRVGASGYRGDAAQGNSSLGDSAVSILEGDIRYRWKGLELTALFSSVNVNDTDKINTATGQVIGEEIFGWYLEGAYHLGRLFLPGEQDLAVFLRYEELDTQEDVDSMLTADPANQRKVNTFGFAYYPIPEIAIKADLENWENGAGVDWHQFNLGMAYMF